MIAFNPDGRRLAIVGAFGRVISIFASDTGAKLNDLACPGARFSLRLESAQAEHAGCRRRG